MIDFKRKLATGLATGAILANAFSPLAFAGTTITISDNGSGSNNEVNFDQDSRIDVDQDNTAHVNNDVNVDAETGHNDANNNTGDGEVSIDTGNAEANVNVSNTLNANSANVACCPSGNTDLKISGNGANSDNTINYDLYSNTDVNQDNDAYVDNDVNVEVNSGDNDANGNTGDGGVSITTGNAKGNVWLSTAANFNHAMIGGNGGGGTLSLWITDNGYGTDNDINADLDSRLDLDQDNHAHVNNDVNVDADTGHNDANNNTGDGEVSIDTGNAEANVNVSNTLNANSANVACCPSGNTDLKISGNGANSDNTINYDLYSNTDVNQDNDAYVDNNVNVEVNSGENDANGNTGDGGVSITTGNAKGNVWLSTAANFNHAMIGGGDGGAGSLSLWITDNGSNSDNDI